MIEEAQADIAFVPSKQPKARLDITLSHLRRAHNYCLFCGHQYSSSDELNISCPGEEEDDH